MSESVSNLEFLLGLEEYLKFENNDANHFVHNLSKSLADSNIEVLKSYLQDIIGPKLPETDKNEMLKIIKNLETENFDELISNVYIKKLSDNNPHDKIFRGILSYNKLGKDRQVLNDVFSRSQIRSKIWLLDELTKISNYFSNVLVMAGWFGQIKSIYDKKLSYSKMRIVELDKSACETSDYIFNLSNLENYKVKSIHADINNLTLHKNGYEWSVENFKEKSSYIEKFLPDLIINTSAEHMTEEWFHQIRFKNMESNPLVAIQSNNLFNLEEHVNCVHSVDHMKKKFPMKEILFEGELQLKGYKRVMLIGRP